MNFIASVLFGWLFANATGSSVAGLIAGVVLYAAFCGANNE